jgi:hypothetical protein
MAAAGHSNGIKGLDYMVREIASFKLWSQAIQAMLKESLNIECNLRTVVDSVWFDDAQNGNFDLAIAAGRGLPWQQDRAKMRFIASDRYRGELAVSRWHDKRSQRLSGLSSGGFSAAC